MNWKRYHRLNVIYSFLEDLERDFPAICTVSVIGKSVEGRSIKVISNFIIINPKDDQENFGTLIIIINFIIYYK